MVPELNPRKSLTVHGASNTFYPVWFGEGCWSEMGTTITIDREDVHTDELWKGSMHLEFKFHSSGGGHGADYWDWKYAFHKNQLWAGFKVEVLISFFAFTNFKIDFCLFESLKMNLVKKGVGLMLKGDSTYTYTTTCADTTVEQASESDPDAPIVYNYQNDPTHQYSFTMAPTQTIPESIKQGKLMSFDLHLFFFQA